MYKLLSQLTMVIVSALAIVFFAQAPTSANTGGYDLNYNALSFLPEPDLTRSNAELKVGFQQRYNNVAIVGGVAIDATISIVQVNGHLNNELDTFDQYDNSDQFSFHTQINGTSTAQASARFRIQFLKGNTNTPVVLKNIRASVADIDQWEFIRFYQLSSYKFGSPTKLSAQTSPVPPVGDQVFISSGSGTDLTGDDQTRVVEVAYDAASTIDVLAGCRLDAVKEIFSNGKCGFIINMGTVLLTGATTAPQTVPQPSYTITYNSNGSTSGTVPTATTASGTQTIATDTGSLEKGTDVFIGWNTKADGTGLTIEPGSSYVPTGNTTLYAMYAPPPAVPHTVTYDPNGGIGTMPDQTSSTTTDLSAENFTRAGYTFEGWNTEANGSGTAYVDGDSYSFTADMTLYAQWKQIPTVKFEENGGTGTMADQISLLSDELNAATFTRTGYEFVGWNTESDGSGELYADGASYPFTENLTLYAQWAAVVVEPTPHKVSFVANGGTGTMPDQTSSTSAELSAETLTRAGYTFSGWNTAANGSGIAYTDEALYSFTADMTLYAQWEPLPHTVTYLANDPTNSTTGTMSPQTSSTTKNLTLESFTRSGYTFEGWNTEADGSGTDYVDGVSYAFTANMTLYAQWDLVVVAQTPHTVTFLANDSTGSTTGTMSAQTSSTAADLTTENFTRPGYVFTGWNTAANGTGTAYVDGASYAFNADMTLYAQWSPIPHTVTFNANDGAGTMADQTSTTSTTLTPEAFTRVGYTFAGWSTQQDGNGTDYVDAATYAFTADMTLYAQWTPIPHTVTFMSNGSTDLMTPQTSADTRDISANTLTRAGYVFAGWNTAADGSGELYADEAEHAFTEDLILYAQWAAVAVPPTPYTVTYLANDPTNSTSGTMSPQTSAMSTNLNSENFTREGFEFIGWATSSSGRGTLFDDGDAYAFRSNMTLYAQWRELPLGAASPFTVTYLANGGSGAMSVQISATAQPLSTNAFHREGFTFTGWNTAADGSGIDFGLASVYGFSADMTLFAQWTAVEALARTGLTHQPGIPLTVAGVLLGTGIALLKMRRRAVLPKM